MTVSLREVADSARVSIATASRALNGRDRVSEATVRLVRETAERLGYQVNPLGKGLREGSDSVVGMIVPLVSNPFYASLVHEFENHLDQAGLKLLIADSHGEIDREIERLNALASRQVRGIFVVPAYASWSRPTITSIAERVPLVQVDRRVEDDSDLAYVGVDNAGGIRQVLSHLAEQGASDIVFVGADDRTSAGHQRARAFSDAAAELGLSTQPPVIDRYLFEFGISAAEQLVQRPVLADAIVAGDDLIAAGVLSGLQRLGVSVPDEVMVTGFDGTILADICSPTLTTVVQPVADIARVAVEQLLQQINGDPTPQHVELPTVLRKGASSAKPAPAEQVRRDPVTAEPLPQ